MGITGLTSPFSRGTFVRVDRKFNTASLQPQYSVNQLGMGKGSKKKPMTKKERKEKQKKRKEKR